MSISQIKKLERERAALKKKIAEERAKIAAKIGGVVMKAVGDEEAEAFAAKLASALTKTSPENVLHAIENLAPDAPSPAVSETLETPVVNAGSR